MNNSPSKVIGKGMMLIGIIIGLYAAITKDPLVAIVGGIILMVGRVIEAYF